MDVAQVLGLIGTASTDAALAGWFAAHGLAAPPKSITANQGRKSVKDRARGMEYHFAFDIINDRFYPPRALKNGSLECSLQAVSLYAYSPKRPAAQPAAFWGDWPGPEATLADCMAFFDGRSSDYGDTRLFHRAIGGTVELKLWFSLTKQRVETIDARLIEDRQFIGWHDFDPDNPHNTTKPASTQLVKWLFDAGHLRLDAALQQRGLADDHGAILAFVQTHLNGHVWASQLSDDPALREVLAHTQTSRPLRLKNGQSLVLLAKHLHLKAAGVWDAYQRLYDDDTLEDWGGSIAAFEQGVVLTPAQRQRFRDMLGEAYRQVRAQLD